MKIVKGWLMLFCRYLNDADYQQSQDYNPKPGTLLDSIQTAGNLALLAEA